MAIGGFSTWMLILLVLFYNFAPRHMAGSFPMPAFLESSINLFTARMSDVPDTPTSRMRAEYDFIVVGAGPGGSTVTNRLTEIPEWNVLLLEAGGDENSFTDIPLVCGYIQTSDMDWRYRTEPQKGACLGLKEGKCMWPRGKVMGGSSVLNYMVYTRGHPRDYNGWEAMGNPGWGWDKALSYFRKSEDARGHISKSPFHSTGGYLTVEEPTYQSEITRSFLASAPDVGLSIVDYNAETVIGLSPLYATKRHGARCSANKAFIKPITHRQNLHIAKRAQVTKVLIDPVTKRAYGVEFHRDGRRWYVRASKEVILSAGAINTPQLLMLSGIGPSKHLRQIGIPVIHDSPGVGQNLQDHIAFNTLTFVVNSTVSIVQRRLIQRMVPLLLDYNSRGVGPLTIAGGVEAIGFVRTNISKTPLDYPDIELMFIAGSFASDDGNVLKNVAGMTQSTYDRVYRPLENKDAFTIWPILMQPESAGYIKLKNRSPFTKPLLYANYLSTKHDIDTIVAGVRYTIDLINRSRALQKYGSKLHSIPIPGCAYLDFDSDEYWRCVVRHHTATVYHQCGTAKMGPSTDPMAVVDPTLRVYGIQGLRVVDASIMPKVPAAHTNAPTYMIGEKAGDLIKESYNQL